MPTGRTAVDVVLVLLGVLLLHFPKEVLIDVLFHAIGTPLERLWNLPPPKKKNKIKNIKKRTSNNQLTLKNLEPTNLQKATNPTRASTRQMDTGSLWGSFCKCSMFFCYFVVQNWNLITVF